MTELHVALPGRVAATRTSAALCGVVVAGLTLAALLATSFGVYVVNGLSLLTGLLCAGLALFLVLPGTGDAAATLGRLLRALIPLSFAASLLTVPFAVMQVDGRGLVGLGDALARDVVLRGSDYQSALVRCVGLAVLALTPRFARRHRLSQFSLLAGAVVVAGSFLLTGHARTHGPAAVTVACGLAHVVAAAGWLGGVVGLGVSLRSLTGRAAARLVVTFAGLMTGVVTMLLAGGLGLAFLYLPSLHGLAYTAYGQVLLVKVAVVSGTLFVSTANHRRLVPLTARGDEQALRVLRVNVALEQVALVAVVLITQVLMRQNPGG